MKNKFNNFVTKTVWYTKRVIVVMGVLCLTGWGVYVGSKFAPTKVMAIDKPVYIVATSTAPVMARVARCESGSSQTKNGQVQLHINKNGSVDIGKYMINLQVWGATATKMGYDLTKESDNEAFAMWLYENKGTQDWSASFNCWYK